MVFNICNVLRQTCRTDRRPRLGGQGQQAQAILRDEPGQLDSKLSRAVA